MKDGKQGDRECGGRRRAKLGTEKFPLPKKEVVVSTK